MFLLFQTRCAPIYGHLKAKMRFQTLGGYPSLKRTQIAMKVPETKPEGFSMWETHLLAKSLIFMIFMLVNFYYLSPSLLVKSNYIYYIYCIIH